MQFQKRSSSVFVASGVGFALLCATLFKDQSVIAQECWTYTHTNACCPFIGSAEPCDCPPIIVKNGAADYKDFGSPGWSELFMPPCNNNTCCIWMVPSCNPNCEYNDVDSITLLDCPSTTPPTC